MDNARVDEERMTMGTMTVGGNRTASETTLTTGDGKETAGAAPRVAVTPFRYVPPPVTAY